MLLSTGAAALAQTAPTQLVRVDGGRLTPQSEAGIHTADLTGEFPGYVYLTSHTPGATYSVAQGANLHVTALGTDYNYWDDYVMAFGVYDMQTSLYVAQYWASVYVDYEQNVYADIDTSAFVPSVGRYRIEAVIYDDWYGEVEDMESFYLTVEKVTASITQVSPNPGASGSPVSFSGNGQCAAGHSITGYAWRSSIDGELSSSASFSTSSLSQGDHTIYFKTRCSNGFWSPEQSTSLTVTAPDIVTAVIDTAPSSPTTQGLSVSFSGHGTDSLTHGLSAYQWRSSRDGVLSTSDAFSTSSLSVGTHTIYFKARCSNSSWSPEVSTVVTITADPSIPVYLPVYRFYNFRKGVHFYTASASERDTVIRTLYGSYKYEGVAYNVNTANPANNTPLYRFYNFKKGVHFYTASAAERDVVIRTLYGTYRYEGVAYNVCATNVAGSTPVYRFLNFRKGVHFYTASATERDTVIRTLYATYRLEGPAFYLAP